MNAISSRPGPSNQQPRLETNTRIQRGSVQSFENRGQRRTNKRKSMRLTPPEIVEIQELWNGMAQGLGCHSAHGAMEAHLLRSPPREDAKRYVLEELARAGGRAPEVKLTNLIVDENKHQRGASGLKRYELKRAIGALITAGKLERVEVEEDGGAPARKDLRLIRGARMDGRMRLALDLSNFGRERRWQSQDESIRLMWETIQVHDRDGGRHNYEPEYDRPSVVRNTVVAAVEKMSAESVEVLRLIYGTGPSQYGDMYGEGLGHIAALTLAVREERARMGGAKVSPDYVLQTKRLDAAFVTTVKQQADEMAVRACQEYKRARAA